RLIPGVGSQGVLLIEGRRKDRPGSRLAGLLLEAGDLTLEPGLLRLRGLQRGLHRRELRLQARLGLVQALVGRRDLVREVLQRRRVAVHATRENALQAGLALDEVAHEQAEAL